MRYLATHGIPYKGKIVNVGVMVMVCVSLTRPVWTRCLLPTVCLKCNNSIKSYTFEYYTHVAVDEHVLSDLDECRLILCIESTGKHGTSRQRKQNNSLRKAVVIIILPDNVFMGK